MLKVIGKRKKPEENTFEAKETPLFPKDLPL